MAKLKQIMYGVTDFPRMIREGAYFVDRTALIPELEKTSYVMFLRPRRFGKSLLCAILQCYYDIDYASQFDELFGSLDIGRQPTPEHSQYLVLDFNFSVVEKTVDRVQASFDFYCSDRINVFVQQHVRLLPPGTKESVLRAKTCPEKLGTLLNRLRGWKRRLYVIIDEYDNFTNTILAESQERYAELCHGEGFFKQFFNEFKGLTTGPDSPVARMFITGVTPVTMDDVTSGFNVAANLSLDPTFACLVGFTHDDLRTMLAYYRAHAGFDFDADAIFAMMRRWYDNYCFSPDCGDAGQAASLRVANPTLVLYFMAYFLQNHLIPRDLVDRNLRMDYMKIRHIITESHKLNGNYHRLEDLISTLGATATLQDSFQARELGTSDNFISFLFYNGLVSVAEGIIGQARLVIPNLTVGEFLHDFIGKAYNDLFGLDPRIFDIAHGMTDFARTGDAHKALDTACGVVSQYWKVRDAAEGERVVQTALCALLYVGHGPYIVRHELEESSGFVDIAFEPQLARYPEIAHAALIELKYFKQDEKLTRAKLNRVRDRAIAQLDRYAQDHDLKRAWNLRARGRKGSVTLHRFVIVFQGPDRILCEEVKQA